MSATWMNISAEDFGVAKIDPEGNESIPPELVEELDQIFSGGIPNTVDLASLLLRMTGHAVKVQEKIE